MAEVSKKPNFFVRTGRAISKWFRAMKSELKKVVWPNGKQLLNNTMIVLVSILIVGIVVCLFDFLAGQGMSLLGNLFR